VELACLMGGACLVGRASLLGRAGVAVAAWHSQMSVFVAAVCRA